MEGWKAHQAVSASSEQWRQVWEPRDQGTEPYPQHWLPGHMTKRTVLPHHWWPVLSTKFPQHGLHGDDLVRLTRSRQGDRSCGQEL